MSQHCYTLHPHCTRDSDVWVGAGAGGGSLVCSKRVPQGRWLWASGVWVCVAWMRSVSRGGLPPSGGDSWLGRFVRRCARGRLWPTGWRFCCRRPLGVRVNASYVLLIRQLGARVRALRLHKLGRTSVPCGAAPKTLWPDSRFALPIPVGPAFGAS